MVAQGMALNSDQYEPKVYWLSAISPGRPATVRGPYTFDDVVELRLYCLRERFPTQQISAAFRAETIGQARQQAALHFPK